MGGRHLVRTAAIVGGAIVWPAMLAAQQPAKSPAVLRPGAAAVHGFSVVLLLGDLQGGTTADNVPTAARKALVDMKDFLPYKSYRLLDTAWILGSIETRATVRLRGSDNQEYELRLTSDPTLASRAVAQAQALKMLFQLSDAGVDAGAAVPYAELIARNRQSEQRRAQIKEIEARIASLDRELQTAERRVEDLADQPDRQKEWQLSIERRREEHVELAKQLAAASERLNKLTLQTEQIGTGARVPPDLDVRRVQLADLESRRKALDDNLQSLRSRYNSGHPQVVQLQAELDRLSAQLAAAREGARPSSGPGRRIIDTSFGMDVGETVVVGTSRLGGGDRAIIALLTAVARTGSTAR
jgi:hypothetical protein